MHPDLSHGLSGCFSPWKTEEVVMSLETLSHSEQCESHAIKRAGSGPSAETSSEMVSPEGKPFLKKEGGQKGGEVTQDVDRKQLERLIWCLIKLEICTEQVRRGVRQ